MVKRLIAEVDRWQRRHRVNAVIRAVQQKVGDDNANLWGVSLALVYRPCPPQPPCLGRCQVGRHAGASGDCQWVG